MFSDSEDDFDYNSDETDYSETETETTEIALPIDAQLSKLQGRAQLSQLEDTEPLLSIIPKWMAPFNFKENYYARISLSTVSVPVYNFNYIPRAVFELSRPGAYPSGKLLKVSYFGGIKFDIGYKQELDDKKNRKTRGRKAKNLSAKNKRQFGTESGFGTSVEFIIRIEFAGKQSDHPVKIMHNQIQIANRTDERFGDLKQCIVVVKEIFAEMYSRVPPDTELLRHIEQHLVAAGERPFEAINVHEFSDIYIAEEFNVYNENYNLNPIIATTGNHSLDLNGLYKKFLDQQEIQRIADICGLYYDVIGIAMLYMPTSDSIVHRAQIKFYTPRYSVNSVLNTTVVVQNSGKIAIHLSNNYYWKDVLWRIIGFLVQVITVDLFMVKVFVQELRKRRSPTVLADTVNDAQIAKFLDSISENL